MSRQELDIEFSALRFDESVSAAGITVTLPDESQWFYRECANPEALAKEKLYWEWVNRFFPTLILERRTVYKEKVPVGSCWKKCFAGEKKLLEYHVKRLVDYNAPLAFAVLFFLNQSYSCLNAYSIDLIDNYKIDRFELDEESDEVVVCTNNMLIRHMDSNNEELLNFVGREGEYSPLNEQKIEFVNEYLVGLLHIASMPSIGWDPVLSEKQVKLRQHLLQFDVFKVVCKLSAQDLQVRIHLFCRQFAAHNSEDFFDYHNAIIKNYGFFLIDVFEMKIKKATKQFLLDFEKPKNDHALTNMDERAFHVEILKSSVGKIYLNAQVWLSSGHSLEYFVRYSSLLTILKNCLLMCSFGSHEIVDVALAFQVVSKIWLGTQQLNPIAHQDNESLAINLNRFSQPAFAQQCIEWLEPTEVKVGGLVDFLLMNKNMLIYIYDRAVAQFKGAQPTSYPQFLSVAQPNLPEGMQLLYQKIIIENNSDQLCEHLFELMRIAPPDFWNLFLRQLAVAVFSEGVIVTLAGSVLLPGSKYDERSIKTDIERLFSVAKVSPQDMIQLNAHFKEALQAQINKRPGLHASGFRTSGSGHALFSAAAAASSQSGSSAPDQQAQTQSSFWAFTKISLPWPFKQS